MENSSKMLPLAWAGGFNAVVEKDIDGFRHGSGFDRARGSYRLLRRVERGW